MSLNAPTKMVWYIAVVLGVLGILATFVTIPVLSGFAFWLVVIALILMLASTTMKGL